MPSNPTIRRSALSLLAAGMVASLHPGRALAEPAQAGAEGGSAEQGALADLRPFDPGQLKLQGDPAKPADLRLQEELRLRPARPALIAAVETLSIFVLWSSWNRVSGTKDWARVTPESIRDNLTSPWVYDDDPFYTNQFGHPYQGSMVFGAARSAGLGFWASSAYPFAFSALWEVAGETERASINDQVTTTIGGIVLGEVFYRAADWIRGDGRSIWRQAVATLVSPVSTVNRTVVTGGDPEPPGPLRLSVGVGALTTMEFDTPSRGMAPSLDLKLTHGVPGSPGWRFARPFDHFDAELFWAATPDPVFSLRARGLMVGREFAEGPEGGGLWGLWLSFDLVGPGTRRVSTSALGVGATGRWALGPTLALEGTAVGSAVLMGASGVTGPVGERAYRFGPGAQGVLETWLSAGDRFRAGLELRPYLVVAAGAPGGRDVLLEAEALARVRLWDHNALEVSAMRTTRWSTEADGADTRRDANLLMVSWRWAVDPPGPGVGRG